MNTPFWHCKGLHEGSPGVQIWHCQSDGLDEAKSSLRR